MRKAWVSAEKRYKYTKSINSTNITVELIWDARWREALVVVSVDNSLYEPDYRPFSFMNSGRAFLKTIKELERINTLAELNEFLNKLN
ncbi:MAG: hypothetical protein JHC31_07310 [Sulfurihydrogenibium sp.]|nr:hypothetical protein [Sulfurihydrogenibium sp.]